MATETVTQGLDVVPGGGCPSFQVVIGMRYECRLPAGHKGMHVIGGAVWSETPRKRKVAS